MDRSILINIVVESLHSPGEISGEPEILESLHSPSWHISNIKKSLKLLHFTSEQFHFST